jgi:phosphatidylserine decarboxylase
VRIARDGLVYIAIPAIIAAILFGLGHWAFAIPFVVVCAFMIYFFRDPHRLPPSEPDVVVAPADGRVTRVASLGSEAGNSPTVVSIFLSPFDVHINRSPIAGRVTDVSYTRGKFLMATNERASLVNEQNALTIEGEKVTLVCKQIAGILARRIVCWKHKNDQVTRGERIGLIKFSSRTDVVLPANVKVTVTEGMKVQGGTTIIGRIQP